MPGREFSFCLPFLYPVLFSHAEPLASRPSSPQVDQRGEEWSKGEKETHHYTHSNPQTAALQSRTHKSTLPTPTGRPSPSAPCLRPSQEGGSRACRRGWCACCGLEISGCPSVTQGSLTGRETELGGSALPLPSHSAATERGRSPAAQTHLFPGAWTLQPKSPIFNSPSMPNSKFSGLMSRWMTCLRCR